jgi:hypothetical protein
MNEKPPDWIKILVKHNGKCNLCQKEIFSGEYAFWSKMSKCIRHIQCNDEKKIDVKNSSPETSHLSLLIPPVKCFICEESVTRMSRESVDHTGTRLIYDKVCICNTCQTNPKVYEMYQSQFLKKLQKLAKVKI